MNSITSAVSTIADMGDDCENEQRQAPMPNPEFTTRPLLMQSDGVNNRERRVGSDALHGRLILNWAIHLALK